jgi:hypothetical protein
MKRNDEFSKPSNSTARTRRFRARQRGGLIPLLIEVDEVQLCAWLVRGEVLDERDTDNRGKVVRALERALTLEFTRK